VRVLVVEDEPELATALAEGLRAAGYAIDVAFDGRQALAFSRLHDYDLVTLDLQLPDLDGLAVCRKLREGAVRAPRVLVLTGRGGLDDRVRGLDVGADDYLVKPFALDELLARLRALSRRDMAPVGALRRVGALELDERAVRVRRAGRPVPLGPKEFALLRYLVLHVDEVLSTEHLLEHVWDRNVDPFSPVVRVTLSGLRRKLGEPSPIETVPRHGYRLCRELA
jgi:DNA-binding response OmpR family regulator